MCILLSYAPLCAASLLLITLHCAGVLVGLLALGERMPATLGMRALRLVSWMCIALGVSALAGGKGAPFHPTATCTAAQYFALSACHVSLC